MTEGEWHVKLGILVNLLEKHFGVLWSNPEFCVRFDEIQVLENNARLVDVLADSSANGGAFQIVPPRNRHTWGEDIRHHDKSGGLAPDVEVVEPAKLAEQCVLGRGHVAVVLLEHVHQLPLFLRRYCLDQKSEIAGEVKETAWKDIRTRSVSRSKS